MLEAALAYGRMGWKVFPLHTIVDGRCSCGSPHADGKSIAKHPRTKRGFKEATDDEKQIRKWWQKWPNSNIGIATGSGLVVIDIDGEAGAAEFRKLVAANGPPPATLTAQTGNGFHLFYLARPGSPQVRSSARGHVHVRGEGGYVVAAPSLHASGRNYRWVKKQPITELPEWLRQWSQGYEISNNRSVDDSGFRHLGNLPNYLASANNAEQKQRDVTHTASEALKTAWSASEQARLVSALTAIPSNNYEIWLNVGMALKTLDWQRPDGTDIGFELFDQWSQTCPDKYALAATEDKWRSFGRRSGITLGTVFHLAAQHGWNGGAPEPLASPSVSEPGPGLNGHHAGPQALPAAFGGQQPIFFPDLDEKKRPRATMTNTKVAIIALGVDCRYDLFHNRMLVAGSLISKWNSAELSDHVTSMLRDHIRYRFGFDPGKAHTQDAAEILCLGHRFDPVLDYLDALTWDGQPRLERWLVTYLGVADNEYSRAVARLSLLAAVRRARKPGTKFDQVIVLEGRQGAGKSEAIRILAGPENFSDQKILGVDDRKQQELTEGVWLYEIAELTGLRKTEIEHVKAFVSRTSDRARPAYGRYMVQQLRRTVFFGSTNPGQPYLQDDTGNRRFWPVLVGRIDLDGLRRDRDQLWAEASSLEAQGVPHMLPERLWKIAAEEQDKRTEGDEWEIPISSYIALKGFAEFSVMDVLADNQFLRLEAKEIGQHQQSRAARVLRGLGFERYRAAPGKNGHRPWKYRKAPAA